MIGRRQLLAAAFLALAWPAWAKRSAPAPVAPVVVGKVRYEAPAFAKVDGKFQNGGVVVAFDAATGKELWRAKVYGVVLDPHMEQDVQDIFIARMWPTPDNQCLIIVDEHRRVWRLDLATHVAVRDTTS